MKNKNKLVKECSYEYFIKFEKYFNINNKKSKEISKYLYLKFVENDDLMFNIEEDEEVDIVKKNENIKKKIKIIGILYLLLGKYLTNEILNKLLMEYEKIFNQNNEIELKIICIQYWKNLIQNLIIHKNKNTKILTLIMQPVSKILKNYNLMEFKNDLDEELIINTNETWKYFIEILIKNNLIGDDKKVLTIVFEGIYFDSLLYFLDILTFSLFQKNFSMIINFFLFDYQNEKNGKKELNFSENKINFFKKIINKIKENEKEDPFYELINELLILIKNNNEYFETILKDIYFELILKFNIFFLKIDILMNYNIIFDYFFNFNYLIDFLNFIFQNYDLDYNEQIFNEFLIFLFSKFKLLIAKNEVEKNNDNTIFNIDGIFNI
jgi:hypothetical protein